MSRLIASRPLALVGERKGATVRRSLTLRASSTWLPWTTLESLSATAADEGLVIIDATELEFMDCAGFAAVTGLARETRPDRAAPAWVGAHGGVARLLDAIASL